MPLPTKDILGILADNLNRRKSVLPMSAADTTRWAKGLNIPKGGKTILYTGHMYQLIPSSTPWPPKWPNSKTPPSPK